MKETDLFKPVRNLLIQQGFEVQGEIFAADVFAVKDKQIVIVELKLNMTLKLIYQAIERQKVTPYVYIGLPKIVSRRHQKSNAQYMTLLKRLGIGLIEVTLDEANIVLDVFDQSITTVKQSPGKKRIMMKEFDARDQYQTIGGTKGKKMTHYREQVVEIAKAIYSLKEAPLSLIKEYTRIDKTANILRDNYDGWFHKNEKGLFELSPLGLIEIKKLLF